MANFFKKLFDVLPENANFSVAVSRLGDGNFVMSIAAQYPEPKYPSGSSANRMKETYAKIIRPKCVTATPEELDHADENGSLLEQLFLEQADCCRLSMQSLEKAIDEIRESTAQSIADVRKGAKGSKPAKPEASVQAGKNEEDGMEENGEEEVSVESQTKTSPESGGLTL